MLSCRYFPECQRCNEVGDSWIPCTGGTDGIQCDAYEPMPDVDALLALAGELERKATELLKLNSLDRSRKRRSARTDYASDLIDACVRIRAACGGECR